MVSVAGKDWLSKPDFAVEKMLNSCNQDESIATQGCTKE